MNNTAIPTKTGKRYLITTGDCQHKLDRATNLGSAKAIARKLSREYFVCRVVDFDLHIVIASAADGRDA